MAHVHCPKCGERLKLPPIQEKRGVRFGVGSEFMDRKGGTMSEMCLVSRVPHRFGRIVPAGLLICFTMLAGVSSTLADEISPPTTQPAMSLSAQKLFAQASPAVVKIHTYNATGSTQRTTRTVIRWRMRFSGFSPSVSRMRVNT